MSNSADFLAHKAEILAFPTEEIKKCNIPYAIYFAEAETLEQVCKEDRTTLINAGLDWTIVEKLPTLTGAARQAQSLWVSDRFSQQEAQEAWDNNEEDALDLKAESLHAFSYGYRNDTYLLGRVAEIEEGTGQADLVQDLNDIAVLGRENPEPLKAINFPLTKLDEAAAMADKMAQLLAAKDSSSDKNEHKKLRDKAFSLLKKIVDEIYACGQYCFWKDKARKDLYSSAYRKSRSRRHYRAKQAQENTETML